MAGLVELPKYDIKDSNIELFGSDLERRVREHGGDIETAWEHAGKEPGVQIWRIEKFHVVPWPEDRKGTFYDGDSYIVLHTYKKSPESESLSYDLHFWLGQNTTQDEAGTAAYKAVELDDHLHGAPVEFREIQEYESCRFLSYFPNFLVLKGGVSTGFRHVSDAPPPDVKQLYRISASTHHGPGTKIKTHISIVEVPAEVNSLDKGDVFVLDLGNKIVQFQPKGTSGKERFLAADFVRRIIDKRPGQCQPKVMDENSSGAEGFLSMLGSEETFLPPRERTSSDGYQRPPPVIFRISEESDGVSFHQLSEPPSFSLLSSSDSYLVDTSHYLPSYSPALYVWIGKDASLAERHLSMRYAQMHLHARSKDDTSGRANPAIPIIRINEGSETDAFMEVFKFAGSEDNGETKETRAG